MKLIDILVEELPRRGGWPKRANCITQDGDLRVEPAFCHPSIAKCDEDGFWFLDLSRTGGFEVDTLASDYTTAIITREQYEAALKEHLVRESQPGRQHGGFAHGYAPAASQAPAADADGWIDWGGGECPVDTKTLVDIRLKVGFTYKSCHPGDYSWRHAGGGGDIIAYRLHQPQEAEQTEADDEADLNECIGQDAAQVWNGEGLPPVGCEFEYGLHRTKAKCLAVAHHMIFASKGNPDDEESDYEEFMISILDSEFHRVRTEADRKRDEAVKTIMLTGWCQAAAEEIYDLVAAGKVPGMKLED